MATASHAAPSPSGISFVEVLIALVMLSIGLLAVKQLLPSGTRGAGSDRMQTLARYYADEKVEEFVKLGWSDPTLAPGRHPAQGDGDNLGAWRRCYRVDVVGAPFLRLKRVTVTVTWEAEGPHAVSATTYMRP